MKTIEKNVEEPSLPPKKTEEEKQKEIQDLLTSLGWTPERIAEQDRLEKQRYKEWKRKKRIEKQKARQQ